MNITDLKNLLAKNFHKHFSIEEKRSNLYQIYLPLYYPDGDMVDMFIQLHNSSNKLVLCDCGLTLMRLSYEFTIDTANKESILLNILREADVQYDNGNIFLETSCDKLYFGVMQLYQALEKVYGMRLLKKENIKSLFYENVSTYIQTQLKSYKPVKDYQPIEGVTEKVDYCLTELKKPIFIYAAQGQNKTLTSIISILTFQKEAIPFSSIIVHDNFSGLTRENQKRIMNIADKQYYSYDSFVADGMSYISRMAV